MIEAKQAVIIWRDDDGTIGEVRVFKQGSADPDNARDLNAEAFGNSAGCIMSQWLVDSRCTPEAFFLQWLMTGFTSRQHLLDALVELGKIRECDWARSMLAGRLSDFNDALDRPPGKPAA